MLACLSRLSSSPRLSPSSDLHGGDDGICSRPPPAREDDPTLANRAHVLANQSAFQAMRAALPPTGTAIFRSMPAVVFTCALISFANAIAADNIPGATLTLLEPKSSKSPSVFISERRKARTHLQCASVCALACCTRTRASATGLCFEQSNGIAHDCADLAASEAAGYWAFAAWAHKACGVARGCVRRRRVDIPRAE